MKMTDEHFKYIEAAIRPLDTPERRLHYLGNKFTSMRYRWDLTYVAPGLTKWMCDNVYPYCNDTHIDTALKRIVPSLEIT